MAIADLFDEHRRYWTDAVRVEAYSNALKQVIKPDMSVLDLGCGTGLLGLLACQAGASKVYGIDSGPILDLATELFKTNGFANRWTPIQGWSTQIEIPERCDIVLADQLGPLGIEAGLLEVFADARRRFLKPGGVLIPGSVELYFAPLEAPNTYASCERWKTPQHGLDCSAVFEKSIQHFHAMRVDDTELRAEPIRGATLELNAPVAELVSCDCAWSFTKATTLHGIAAWFEAWLAPGISITNSPLSEHPLNREQAFFPFPQPLELPAHTELHFELQALPASQMYTWTTSIAISCPSEKRFTQSTFKGLFTCESWMRRTLPTATPGLSMHGAAVQYILSLCDGKRTVEVIERLAYEQHRNYFRTPEQAAVLVAEVLRSHAR